MAYKAHLHSRISSLPNLHLSLQASRCLLGSPCTLCSCSTPGLLFLHICLWKPRYIPLKRCKLHKKNQQASTSQQFPGDLELIEMVFHVLLHAETKSCIQEYCGFCQHRQGWKNNVAVRGRYAGTYAGTCTVVNTQPHLHLAELQPVSLHFSCKRLQLQPSCFDAACGQLQLLLQHEGVASLASLQSHCTSMLFADTMQAWLHYRLLTQHVHLSWHHPAHVSIEQTPMPAAAAPQPQVIAVSNLKYTEP